VILPGLISSVVVVWPADVVAVTALLSPAPQGLGKMPGASTLIMRNGSTVAVQMEEIDVCKAIGWNPTDKRPSKGGGDGKGGGGAGGLILNRG
jgi:hypothetical protein